MDEEVLKAIFKARKVAVGSVVLTCTQIYKNRSRRGNAISRPLFSFGIFITGVQPAFFARMYRMPKDIFFVLAERISTAGNQIKLRSCPLMRLSITLRWLAGGSYLDLAMAHHVSVSSVYNHIDNTISAIDTVLRLHFPYNDKTWLERSSLGFSRNGRSPISGCCAALDGIAIKIAEPASRDVPNPSTYYNRKGFFALNIQALCDSSYRFLFVSALTPGSTHDSTALSMSSLSSLVSREESGLLDKYWIAADEAYVCTKRIICPWPGKNLSIEKDCFNYWQSSARIHIEQAFGILVARWGIFWRPMRIRISKSAKVVAVCCKLHNFIIDNSDTTAVPQPSGLDNSTNNEPVDTDLHLQDTCDTEEQDHDGKRSLGSSAIRDEFTEAIRAEGLERPAVY